MGGCRQTFNLWFYIKKVFKPYPVHWGRWKCFRRLMKLEINHYFWHDTFGRYFNQFVLCLCIGHRNVQWLYDGGCDDERPRYHCFNCEQEVDPGVDKIKKLLV